MSRKGPTLSDLVQQIVREAPEPLTVDTIAERLEATAPGISKNYKSSVRNAITNSQSGAIVTTGDGRYGWKPCLIRGATLRHILHDEDLLERELPIGDALRDLLAPLISPFEKDETALRLELEGIGALAARLVRDRGEWHLDGGAAFWDWLAARKARPGDSLIFIVLDGEALRYGLRLERAAARDEGAIAARNRLVVDEAAAYLRRKEGRAPSWEIVAHLNISEVTHHPVPSDPFEELWTSEVYGPIVDDYGGSYAYVASFDALISDMEEEAELPDETKDGEGSPTDLPPAYRLTGDRRKPQPSPAGSRGPVRTYTLELTYRDKAGFSRHIEIAEDQNFEDLHLAIQETLGWGDDHLYSFFMGRRPYMPKTEIGAPWSDAVRKTYRVTLGSLGLKPRQRFLYLFDYGDEHLFALQVTKIDPQAPKGAYPKVVGREGRPPKQ